MDKEFDEIVEKFDHGFGIDEKNNLIVDATNIPYDILVERIICYLNYIKSYMQPDNPEIISVEIYEPSDTDSHKGILLLRDLPKYHKISYKLANFFSDGIYVQEGITCTVCNVDFYDTYLEQTKGNISFGKWLQNLVETDDNKIANIL